MLRSSKQSLDIVAMLVIDEKAHDERNNDILNRRTEEEKQKRHQRRADERAQRHIPPLQEHNEKDRKKYRDDCRLEGEKETEGGGHAFSPFEAKIDWPQVSGKGSKAACCNNKRRLTVGNGEPRGQEPLQYVTCEGEDADSLTGGPHDIGGTDITAACLSRILPLQL